MDEMIQGSDDWHAARVGKVTASRISDLMAKTKTGWGASRANYMAELVAERLAEQPAEKFVSAAMQWGIDNEPRARRAYEWQECVTVDQIGFVPHPTIPMTGASPDGLVGSGGLVEIKCPNTATHIDTLLGVTGPSKYLLQMQWQMACTERKWCDFVSFDPRMPAEMQLFRSRIIRDDPLIAEIELAVTEFLSELAGKVEALRRNYPEPAGNDLLMAG